MFRFYLNNNLVSDPINWDDFSETIERDDIIKGLLPKYEVKLKFNAGGYKYLNDLKNTSGFCNLVELRIEYKCGLSYETILEGTIFLNECRFNLNKCIVDCEVEDNNYGARIHRNKSIKVYLNTDKTKNGEDLTLCTSYGIQMFTPSTGSYSGSTRKFYDVKDAFRFLIEFMTDNLVGFESDYLTHNTLVSGGMGLITGDGIRLNTASSKAPFISFEELFKEVNKKYPIAFTIITGTDGRPTVKIEEEGYFYKSASGIQLENIQDLIQYFDNEVLYSSVRFGGTTADYNVAIHSFGQSTYLAFKEEQYFLQGECNIDKTLDLHGEFIVDSNIIEELFVTATSNDSYDEDTFLVQVVPFALNQAVKTGNPLTGATPYYYNGNLTNDQVANRYYLNGNLTLFLPGGSLDFRASKTITQDGQNASFPAGGASCPLPPESRAFTGSEMDVLFQDDSTAPNFDTSSSYNTSTSRYTASAPGLFVFQTQIRWSAVNFTNDLFNMYVKGIIDIRRYNSANVLMQSVQTDDPVATGGFYNTVGARSSIASASFNMDTGDYVKVFFWVLYCPENCLLKSSMITKIVAGIDETWFKSTASPSSGGEFKPNLDPYLTSRYEFDQPISHQSYTTLKTDLSESLLFNYKPLTDKTGWIRKTIRKYSTGETKWELITNINNSN